MTRSQAQQTAVSLQAAGWPVVYVEMNDDGKWRAVAEDPEARDGWLTRLMSIPNNGINLSKTRQMTNGHDRA
jgi:hypothetical protein